MTAAGVEYFSAEQSVEGRADLTARLIHRIRNLGDLPENPLAYVVGCGPKPESIATLVANGLQVIGVEPIEGFVTEANSYLDNAASVQLGTAESMPFPDESCDIVLLESVLEHVESPRLALSELYRVLKPGGILYVTTTNRWHISLRGTNGEYRVPFFNWFPRIVQESYVFRHLHYQPSLANYSPRPAVHWFSYPDLCALGRDVGFAQFYSFIDVDVLDNVPPFSLRGFLLRAAQASPWFRGLMLTQLGGTIFMCKR